MKSNNLRKIQKSRKVWKCYGQTYCSLVSYTDYHRIHHRSFPSDTAERLCRLGRLREFN